MRRNWLGASEGASVYIFAWCGGSILTNLIFSFVSISGNGNLMGFLPYAVTQIAFLLVMGFYIWWRRIDFLAVTKAKKFINWKQGLLLPFISIASIITFLPISNMFVALFSYLSGGQLVMTLPSMQNPGVFVLGILVLCIMPAFCEEFLMRGMVLNGLNTKNLWFGVCISALLFSLMHGNVLQTVHQFGLGVVLALMVVISGSIWPAVIIHFLNNFISIVTTTYIPEIDEIFVSLGNWVYLTNFIAIILGAILLVCLLYLFYRFGENRQDGYRVVSDGIVFDEFAIYATAEEKKEDKKYKFDNSVFMGMWRYFASLFTKQGWVNTTRELESRMGVPSIGRKQPMLNVWLAIGFSAVNWFTGLVFLLV